MAGEVTGLLSKTIQAASLIVRPRGSVETVTIYNALPSAAVAGGVMIELGDLWAGEERKLVLGFAVPAMAGLGLAEIASLELRYVTVPAFVEETVTVPLTVNVVPGDQAAGRVRDAKVSTERLFQQAQEAKRRAADALSRGDSDGALAAYAAAGSALAAAPAPSAELREEASILASLADHVTAGEPAVAAKRSRAEHALKARQRGRGA